MSDCNHPEEVRILQPDTLDLIKRDIGVDIFSATFSDGRGRTVLATPQNVRVELFEDQAAVWTRVNPITVRRLIDEPAVAFHGSPDQVMQCKKDYIVGREVHRHYLLTRP
jgi:hypothetical protein